MKGKLTISRPSYGDGRRKISINVKDVDAGIRFLELEIDLDSFAEAITGLSEIECDLKVMALHNVGKKIERNKIEFKLPSDDICDRKYLAEEELDKVIPEGWSSMETFSSQNSFFKVDGEPWARANIMRWIIKG